MGKLDGGRKKWHWIGWALLALFILFVCLLFWELYDYQIHTPKIMLKKEPFVMTTGSVVTLDDLCEITCQGDCFSHFQFRTDISSVKILEFKEGYFTSTDGYPVDGILTRRLDKDGEEWWYSLGYITKLYVGDEAGTIYVTICASGESGEHIEKNTIIYVNRGE
ncbi:MAG: hypothetical protein K6F51_02860 [Acetatifactor sp.]|nr:hypothetical protein [Acetatifactor sp.]